MVITGVTVAISVGVASIAIATGIHTTATILTITGILLLASQSALAVRGPGTVVGDGVTPEVATGVMAVMAMVATATEAITRTSTITTMLTAQRRSQMVTVATAMSTTTDRQAAMALIMVREVPAQSMLHRVCLPAKSPRILLQEPT